MEKSNANNKARRKEEETKKQRKAMEELFLQQKREAIDGFEIKSSLVGTHFDAILSVAVTGDNKYIISGSADKTIRVSDIANKTPLHRFEQAHSDAILSVAVTGDDKYIISGSARQDYWSVGYC